MDLNCTRRFPKFPVLVVLSLLAAVTYYRALFLGLILDDHAIVAQTSFWQALSNFLHPWGLNQFYRPITQFSFYCSGILGDLFTAESQSIAQHSFNVAIHLANSLLLLFIFQFRFPFVWSACCAALFLVSPVNHESVLWISGRASELGLFFSLLAVFMFKTTGRLRAVWFSLNCLFAFLSYEGSVFTPLAFAIFFLDPRNRKAIFQSYGTAALLYLIARAFATGFSSPYSDAQNILDRATMLLFSVLRSIRLVYLFYLSPLISLCILAAGVMMHRCVRSLLLSVAASLALGVLTIMVFGFGTDQTAPRFLYAAQIFFVMIPALILLSHDLQSWSAMVKGFACFIILTLSVIEIQFIIDDWADAQNVSKRSASAIIHEIALREKTPKSIQIENVPTSIGHAVFGPYEVEASVREEAMRKNINLSGSSFSFTLVKQRTATYSWPTRIITQIFKQDTEDKYVPFGPVIQRPPSAENLSIDFVRLSSP